jgi:hypothetical protein
VLSALDEREIMKTVQRLHGALQFITVCFAALVAVSEVVGWPKPISLVFGLVGAIAGLVGYFTGKRMEVALEREIHDLTTEQAGRVLTPIDLQILTSGLYPVQKSGNPIHLIALQGNRESIKLAASLKPAFENAGFAVDGVWEDGLIGGTGSGVLIRQQRGDGPVGVAIYAALQRVGLQARIVEMGRGSQNKIEVIVAYRP